MHDAHGPYQGSADGAVAAPSQARHVEDEDEWAANPWQQQADAHILQLNALNASGGRLLPQAPGGGFAGFSMPNGSMVVGVPAVLCGAPVQGQGVGSSACSPVLGAVLAPGLPPLQPLQVSGRREEDLLQCIHTLEGQVAFLEEQAIIRDRELQEAKALSGTGEVVSPSSGRALDMEELHRKNQFLSVLVTRYEQKTMDMEQELANLTVALDKRQAEDVRKSGVLDLEGQVALLEDAAAAKDKDLNRLRTELEEHSRQPAQDPRLAAEVADLRQKNEWLSGLIERFEKKTMATKEEVSSLKVAQRRHEKAADEATTELLEVRVVAGELRCELLEQRKAAEAEASQLSEAAEAGAAEAEERLRQGLDARRQESEAAALQLRDLKREHNRKVQDLLRRSQVLDTKCRNLEQAGRSRANSSTSGEAAGEDRPRGRLAAGAAAEAESSDISELTALLSERAAELGESRELNAKLIERAAKDRLELAASRAEARQVHQELQAAERESGTMQERIDGLCSQLYDLAELNDQLEAEAKDEAAAAAAATAMAARLQEGGLDAMS